MSSSALPSRKQQLLIFSQAIGGDLTAMPLKRFRKEFNYATFHGKLCTIGVFALQILFLIIKLSLTKPLSEFDAQLCLFFAFLTLMNTFLVKWFLYDSINAEGQYLLQQVMHEEMIYYYNAVALQAYDIEESGADQAIIEDDQGDSSSLVTLASHQGTVQRNTDNNVAGTVYEQPTPPHVDALVNGYVNASYKLYKTSVLHYVTVSFVFIILLITMTLILPEIAIPYFFCTNFIALVLCSIVFTFMWKKKSVDYYYKLHYQYQAQAVTATGTAV